jgi:hypothetical protein
MPTLALDWRPCCVQQVQFSWSCTTTLWPIFDCLDGLSCNWPVRLTRVRIAHHGSLQKKAKQTLFLIRSGPIFTRNLDCIQCRRPVNALLLCCYLFGIRPVFIMSSSLIICLTPAWSFQVDDFAYIPVIWHHAYVYVLLGLIRSFWVLLRFFQGPCLTLVRSFLELLSKFSICTGSVLSRSVLHPVSGSLKKYC